jgi:hypothetical protein
MVSGHQGLGHRHPVGDHSKTMTDDIPNGSEAILKRARDSSFAKTAPRQLDA